MTQFMLLAYKDEKNVRYGKTRPDFTIPVDIIKFSDGVIDFGAYSPEGELFPAITLPKKHTLRTVLIVDTVTREELTRLTHANRVLSPGGVGVAFANKIVCAPKLTARVRLAQ